MNRQFNMAALAVIVFISVNNIVMARQWINFAMPPNVTYDVKELTENPELIQAQEIEVRKSMNKLIKSMDRDIDNFKNDFKKYIDKTNARVRQSIQQDKLKLPLKPELHHQYGMLFNHHGYMMPGLQSLQLFLAVDLPKIEDLHHTPPPFPNCTNWTALYPVGMQYYETMGEAYVKWTAYHEFNESFVFLDEAVHHKVCIQYQTKYNNLLHQIQTLKDDIVYKIKTVMPRLLPNEHALLYGKQTKLEHDREKRAVPIGLIFSRISAISGLIIKGFNAISNYKKSKAMAKAMKELYRAQEIDHMQLKQLEHHTSLLAKATKTAFLHIEGKLADLDIKIDNVIDNLKTFMAETMKQFKYTWQVTVANRLAIKLLSSGSAIYDRVLHQYLQYYINYQLTLDHFLTGLDSLGTGRLTYQVLDPDELTWFLNAIAHQLHKERLLFQLSFNHTYQYYAEPMVTFSNTHDQLLVNVPVLLRLTDQQDLMLYLIDTVPMPFDTETLDGENDEYTFINNSYPYMAINLQNYIPLDK